MTQVTNASGKIWMALKSHLMQWRECKVMLPEETYEPNATSIYLITQHATTEYGGPLPVSARCGVPIVGFINLSVMVPTNLGYDAHIGLAGRVADYFEDGLRMEYDDVTVEVSGRARVIGPPSLQAPWNRLEVTVPWRAWG